MKPKGVPENAVSSTLGSEARAMKNILSIDFPIYCLTEFSRHLVFSTDCFVFSKLLSTSPRSNNFYFSFLNFTRQMSLSFLTTLTVLHRNAEGCISVS